MTLLTLLLLLLAGCGPVQLWPAAQAGPTPTASATPAQPSATPSTTPVWFPPTATFTPRPSATLAVTPTLDVSPSYGALRFSDDFQKPELWSLGRMAAGTAALGNGELSLGASGGRGYLVSLRQETALDDFYLEITAAPSICRDGDEYGLLVRVAGPQSFIRLGLNCQGEVRLDRLNDGQASFPFPPRLSGVVPPGAPSSSRLAVWAQERDLRFYANGVFLFALRDTTLLRGTIGVYARSLTGEAMTINFSDLAVYDSR